MHRHDSRCPRSPAASESFLCSQYVNPTSQKDACDDYINPSLRSGSRRWSDSFLHVFVVPREVALPTIALITRSLNAVVLVRIDDELCVDAETAQRLVHLLTTLNRNVEIAFAAEEERRRLDSIRVQERIRDLHIRLPRFWVPGWSNLVIVLNDVLIGAVECDSECGTGAASRGFEASITGDQVVSQN